MALVLHPHYACGSENSHMYVFGGEIKRQRKILPWSQLEKSFPRKRICFRDRLRIFVCPKEVCSCLLDFSHSSTCAERLLIFFSTPPKSEKKVTTLKSMMNVKNSWQWFCSCREDRNEDRTGMKTMGQIPHNLFAYCVPMFQIDVLYS